jgi:glycosyltransferase involved in cell wall biosynthesis
VRYGGTLGASRLAEIRGDYIYSIVAWNPTNENQRFAAPNKFFESIAAGVPPIAAPHPQCEEVLSRYRCGLLMPDWGFDAFHDTIQKALRIYETDAWDEMVAQCARAAKADLNWDAQFEKLLPYLARTRKE